MQKIVALNQQINIYSKRNNISFRQKPSFFEQRIKKLKDMGEKEIKPDYVSKQFDKLTKEEQNILYDYLANYRQYNETLRDEKNDKSALDKIQRLDKIIEKSKPLESEKIVYRAINEQKAKQYINDLCLGKIVEDKAFMSTANSLNIGEFKYWASEKDSFILRIHLPKGTKGAYLVASEYLLPRNSKLKLNNFDKDLKIADVEYILPLVSEGNKLNSSKLIKYGSVTAIAAIGLGYSLYLFHNKSNKETCVK